MPQTLHNWVVEELSGRSGTAALLSQQAGEGQLEERCKQVVPHQPITVHRQARTACRAVPTPSYLKECEMISSVALPFLPHLHALALSTARFNLQ